ncbi:MAG TPA: hypothetical protein DCY42_05545 [Chloroflexi bacterium]|nr:hypothetical protein [Chloroflexota bacterium]
MLAKDLQMNTPAKESADLASLLSIHRDEIIARWAKKIQNFPNTRYQKFSLGDISDWLDRDLKCILLTLDDLRNSPVETCLRESALRYLSEGFSMYEVSKGLFLFKQAVMPILQTAFPSGSPAAYEAIAKIDTSVSELICQYEYLFSEEFRHLAVYDERQRLAESESLRRTMAALLQKLNLDEVLEIVCSEACRLTNTTGSAVLLLEDEWLKVSISIGNPLPVVQRIPVTDTLAGQSLNLGKPIVENSPSEHLHAYHLNPDLKSLLIVPLTIKGTNIGVLDVVNKPGRFTEDDIRIMGLFADQAAIAIENARLHKQSEQLAVLEERQRLARELHDSVTQSLYSASLYVTAAQRALQKEKIDVAADNLQNLRNMTHEAMLDMRLLIFELHPPILEKEGLVTALRTRLESVEARAGVRTEFQVEGNGQIPLYIETELYRIAQEALTNVVKHAKAQQVKVHLIFNSKFFRLRVWDDGVGFDSTTADQSGGRGLTGIQERIKRINGVLKIESTPGKGTELEVSVEI